MALSFAEQWAAQVAAGIEATNQSRLEEAAASGEDTFQALSTDGSGDVLTLDVQTGVPTTPAEELVAAGPSQEDVFKQLDDITTGVGTTDVTNGGSDNPTFGYGMANETQITKNGNSYGITLADGTKVSASKDLGLVYGQDYGKGVDATTSVANINNALQEQKIEDLGGTDNAAVSAYLAQQEEAARLQKIADDKSDDQQAAFQQENLDRLAATGGKQQGDGFLTDLAGAGQSLIDLGGNVYDDISSGYNYLKDTITGDKGYEDATLFADVGSGYPLGDVTTYGEGMGEGQDQMYYDGTTPVAIGGGGYGGGNVGNGGGGNGGSGSGNGGNGGGGNGGGGGIPAAPVITPPPVIPVDGGTSIPGVGVPVVNPITPSGPGVIPGLDPITGANPYLVESTKDYGKDPRFENLAPNFLVSKSAMPILNRKDPFVPLPVVEEIEEETSLLAQGGIVSLQGGGEPMDQIAKDFYINLIPRALTEKDGGGLARKIAGVHGKYGLGIDEETFHALKYYRGPGGGMKNGGVAGRGYTHEGIGGLSDTARNMFRPMVS